MSPHISMFAKAVKQMSVMNKLCTNVTSVCHSPKTVKRDARLRGTYLCCDVQHTYNTVVTI